MDEVIAAALAKFSGLDILINNAGQGMYGKFEDIKIAEYKEIMEKFLVEDFDNWMKKVDKFDEEDVKKDNSELKAHLAEIDSRLMRPGI